MAALSELLNPVPGPKSMSSEPTNGILNNESAEIASDMAPKSEHDPADEKQLNDAKQHELSDMATAIPDVVQKPSTCNDVALKDEESKTQSTGTKTSGGKSKKIIDALKKDSRHSSKNEGQHTDRRYLCYLCDKLFTRRRSVRDHIAKIHNIKTWEPSRSLEIVVEPESGEPMPPLEEQIAAGGAPPLPKIAHDDIGEEDEEPPKTERKPSTYDIISPTAAKVEPSADSRSGSVEPAVPAPIIGKKRPLSTQKKGVTRKTLTPNKRPKLAESEQSTPFRSPSVASVQRGPTSRLVRATESPASSQTESRDASESASPEPETPGSTNDDGEVFCICRKGDNHTWMIACDGGCEEWFHGNCVDIKERDGELIDKYVCPRCQKEGFHTTWKRRCRRKGCRKPARVLDNPPSKYCSRDCGRMFLVDLVKRGDPTARADHRSQHVVEMERPKKKRRRIRRADPLDKMKKLNVGNSTPGLGHSRAHTPIYSEDEKSEYETDSSVDDDMLPNRGGPLRAGELKALSQQCSTIESWLELGRKPATPPHESDSMDIDSKPVAGAAMHPEPKYDDFEKVKLRSIHKERATRLEQQDMLMNREKFLEIVKVRSLKIADEVKKANPKQKDPCGYDPRLAWTDEEFVQWLDEQDGRSKLQSGDVGILQNQSMDKSLTNGEVNGDGAEEADEDDSLPTKDGVCIKNRCARHGANRRWEKAQLAELRFEQDIVTRALQKLDLQEMMIKDRGVLRARETQTT